jgi:hypothetical protein
MRSRLLTLVLAWMILLAGTCLVAGIARQPWLDRWSLALARQHWLVSWDLGLLTILLVIPLLEVGIGLAVLFSRDSGPKTDPKGELEQLLQQKSRGSLLHRSQRIRESAARTARHMPVRTWPPRWSSVSRQSPLDQLIELKRSGALRLAHDSDLHSQRRPA